MQRLAVLAAALLLLVPNCLAQLRLEQQPSDVPCFTGVAKLVMTSNDCPPLLDAMANLSSPFDPKVHVPWDCLDELAVSVQSCVVSMASMVNASQQLDGFSCSWLMLQGYLLNGTHASMQSWLRPSPVARYILGSDLELTVTDLNAPEKPPEWQSKLQELIREGSHLVSDPALPGYVKLSQIWDSCNTTFQVVEGGIMGMGKVNRSSLGMVVMPSPARYSSPILVRGDMNWRGWANRARGVFIALVVMVSVFGALLMACLGLLAWRLCKAGKRKRPLMASLNDGVGHIPTTQMDVALTGASTIENGVRRPANGGL